MPEPEFHGADSGAAEVARLRGLVQRIADETELPRNIALSVRMRAIADRTAGREE